MAVWVFCVSCNSALTNGNFNDGASWWNATTGTSYALDPAKGPRYVPTLHRDDLIYFALQVDGGANNSLASDLRAALGRRPASATMSSPFKDTTGIKTQCNVGGAPSALNVRSGQNPLGPWAGIGPYTIYRDDGRPNQKSKYEFIVTASLTGGAQFGEDPEMDVDNGGN